MDKVLQTRKKESYKIFDKIAGTYDIINKVLSFGIDIYWRTFFLKYLPNKHDIKALDLATGTGDVPLVLIKDKKVHSVKGLDLSQGMVQIGIDKIEKKGLSKEISLGIGDGVTIPEEDNSFDLITISFGIRNFNDPQESLNNIHRVLKSSGRVLIMEFSIPESKLIKAFYFFYFRNILPLIGNFLSGHQDAYAYLNQTVEDFPYGEDFTSMMKKSGFKNVGYKKLTFGIASLYFGDKT